MIRTNNALRLFTYGIYFLGCRKGETLNAMIASWVMQVSFEPRRVAVGVKKDRFSHDLIREGGVFSLCVLRKNQRTQMDLLKGQKRVDENTIEGMPYEVRKTGAPVLRDCAGFVECRLVHSVDAGDHTIFIGEVVNEEVHGGDPLTAWDLAGHYYGG